MGSRKVEETLLAGVIFSYNRPKYLEKVVKSLSANSVQPDWWLFQDKSDCAGQCVDIFNAHLKGQTVLAPERKHIHQQKLEAHSLFDHYNKIIFFEDDMIVSKYYVSVLLSLSVRLPENIVHASDHTHRNSKDRLVIASTAHWWGYLMPRSLSPPFTERLRDYVSFVGPDYPNRDHDEIRKRYNFGITSHDGAVLNATSRDKKIRKYVTTLPRGRYIGEEGVHATPEWFKKQCFDQPRSFEFENDENVDPSEWIIKG